tara:strand:+ start:275 stop:676 length:402 start_codon:yes stop_codon:yes gene_type:complete
MASLEGKTIADTYKQLLKITSEALGDDDSAKYIEDGEGTDSALSLSTNRVGIGTTSPTAKLHIDQASTSGAVPVLKLDQADIDDTFIDFIGTSAADSTRSISSSTATASSKFGAIAIEINGVKKWIRVYDSAV